MVKNSHFFLPLIWSGICKNTDFLYSTDKATPRAPFSTQEMRKSFWKVGTDK